MISFIVTTYSNPSSLRTCLSSIIDQTCQDSEIICCDNTPDISMANINRELCRQLDPNIIYEWTSDRTKIDLPEVKHKRCLYTATEIGVGLSSGDWLCFPNADSYYAPVFVERMYNKIAENDWELIYSNFILGGLYHPYWSHATNPRHCEIDKTCFIVKRNWFNGFPEKYTNYNGADGFFVEGLVKQGIKHGRLDEFLVVHN